MNRHTLPTAGGIPIEAVGHNPLDGADLAATKSIRKTPGVVGGEARIGHFRFAVWMLVEMRQLGFTDGRILEGYPFFRPADLAAAWSYYDANRAEIDDAIRRNQSVTEP